MHYWRELDTRPCDARFLIGAFALMSALPPRAVAEAAEATSPHHGLTSNQKGPAGELVRIVREATERFQDVEVAKKEGYGLLFGCVSGDDNGAMGLHFVNLALVADPALDPTRPEIVIYEPRPNGQVRLIGADFLVFKADWDAEHPNEGPRSWGSSCTCSRARIASACRTSTRSTSGRGRTTRPARS